MFSLLLSWGKNLSFLTELFINYVPFYNKFRAVSSIQVILELCFPILAALGLDWALTKQPKFDFKKFAKISLAPAIFLIVLLLFKGVFSFVGMNDEYYTQLYGDELVRIIQSARVSVFQEDVLRAVLIMIILAALVFWYQIKNVKKNLVLGIVMGILVLDLLGISTRYISRDAFVSPSRAAVPFQVTGADLAIQQDSSRFRVFEPQMGLTGARTAYFHNTLGGYHGAKPRRFEELFEYYNTHQISGVLDFLNVKYVLIPDEEDKNLQPLANPNAFGNAWMIENLKVVPSADALLEEMKTTNFSKQALIIDQTFPQDLPLEYTKDTLARIELKESAPDHLLYEMQSNVGQFVVFSEMHYPNGWTATINGENTPIHNVNYVLRGLQVPEGESRIEFKFDPPVVAQGALIRWVSLILFLLSLTGLYFIHLRKQNKAD